MSEPKPLLINGTSTSLVRASSEKFDKCEFCKCRTPRVIVFKRHQDVEWQLKYICDFCLDGIKKLDWQNQGL